MREDVPGRTFRRSSPLAIRNGLPYSMAHISRVRTIRMKSTRLFLILTAAFFMVAAGCSRLPFSGPLPANLAAEKIAAVDDGSPFAVSPDGKNVAYLDSGLRLFQIPTRERRDVSPKSPQKLAWS